MPASVYHRFVRTIHRITLLYEVSVDSYRALYDSGRRRLRHPDGDNPIHELKLQNKETRNRPLHVVTYQARDLYPEMLRSTLLIRLVAAYEAFLTDSLRELGDRSSGFLKSDSRLDLSQAHLLSLVEEEAIIQFVLNKTLRSLSSGGFRELAKFYEKMGVDVAPPGVSMDSLEEIHERRHLYVHARGAADEQYCKKYPASCATTGRTISVAEDYLFSAMKELEDSARHIAAQLEAKFPESTWVYNNGSQKLSEALEHANLFSGTVVNEVPLGFDTLLPDGGTRLEDVTVWVGRNDKMFKLLVGGSAAQAQLYSKHIYLAERGGHITRVKSEKLIR